MWRLGDWQGSKCKCKCFAAFLLRTKSFTLICIYGDCNAVLLFTSRKKSRLLFCFRHTCFSIKLETEWFDILLSRMLFVRVLCDEYHVLNNNPSYSRILIGSCRWSIRGQTQDWRHHYRVFASALLKSFENHDNILRDWAKDKVYKSLAEALNRFEKTENKS